jgi:hypothetical protein
MRQLARQFIGHSLVELPFQRAIFSHHAASRGPKWLGGIDSSEKYTAKVKVSFISCNQFSKLKIRL